MCLYAARLRMQEPRKSKFGQNRCILVVFAHIGRQYTSEVKCAHGLEEYTAGLLLDAKFGPEVEHMRVVGTIVPKFQNLVKIAAVFLRFFSLFFPSPPLSPSISSLFLSSLLLPPYLLLLPLPSHCLPSSLFFFNSLSLSTLSFPSLSSFPLSFHCSSFFLLLSPLLPSLPTSSPPFLPFHPPSHSSLFPVFPFLYFPPLLLPSLNPLGYRQKFDILEV